MRYVEVQAENNYDAGKQIGDQVGDLIREYTEVLRPKELSAEILREKSKSFLTATLDVFPQYIEEMKGLAAGAGMEFFDLWAVNCADEILEQSTAKCTSFFVRSGDYYIAGHSEDWSPGIEKYLYIQKRTIGGVTVFEQCYASTLGGFGGSVNSFGLGQMINSLVHSDSQVGVPKKVIGRWLSEAPSFDFIKTNFRKITRASGLCHNFIQRGELMNLETSAKEFDILEAEGNYFHTNHYTRDLKRFESERLMGFAPTSHIRYELASRLIQNSSTVDDMKRNLSFKTDDAAICESDTIGSAVFDLGNKKAYIALDRPNPETRWQEYTLDFIL